jgi:hypothetical protein
MVQEAMVRVAVIQHIAGVQLKIRDPILHHIVIRHQEGQVITQEVLQRREHTNRTLPDELILRGEIITEAVIHVPTLVQLTDLQQGMDRTGYMHQVVVRALHHVQVGRVIRQHVQAVDHQVVVVQAVDHQEVAIQAVVDHQVVDIPVVVAVDANP